MKNTISRSTAVVMLITLVTSNVLAKDPFKSTARVNEPVAKEENAKPAPAPTFKPKAKVVSTVAETESESAPVRVPNIKQSVLPEMNVCSYISSLINSEKVTVEDTDSIAVERTPFDLTMFYTYIRTDYDSKIRAIYFSQSQNKFYYKGSRSLVLNELAHLTPGPGKSVFQIWFGNRSKTEVAGYRDLVDNLIDFPFKRASHAGVLHCQPEDWAFQKLF